MLSSMIWIVVGILAGTSAGFLMVAIISDLKTFNEFISEIMNNLDALFGSGSLMRQLGMMVLVLILGVLKSLSEIYASMAVGHQFNSHRGIMSIAAYIVFSIIEMCLGFMPFIRKLGERGGLLYNEQLSGAFPAAVVFSLVGILVYGTITWKLLDSRLNLE
jgi:hypothetical protein